MKVEYINPFISSLISTFDMVVECEVRRVSLCIKEDAKPHYDLSGMIGLSGKAVGTVVLSFSEQVALKGIIDRIDQKGDVIRIVDYKSGRDERTFKEVETLVDGTLEKRDKAVFQLFYYCMLYKANHPENQLSLRPGIFNSKDLFDRDFDMLLYKSGRPKKPVLAFEEFEEEFMISMTNVLTEIFNSSHDFVQTADLKKCQYCPYQQICMKG